MSYTETEDAQLAAVIELLEPGDWVRGTVLEAAGGQGRSGLRRVRSLRSAGIPVEGRRIKGSSDWEYRIPGLA